MSMSVVTWSHLPEWGTAAQIVLVNVALSADNALVIALAAHKLPLMQRRLAVLGGGALAIVLRIVLTLLAACLLKIPGLLVAGGLLLFYVACKLIAHENSEKASLSSSHNVLIAVRTIVFADVAMSLDNVLAVAGASGGDWRQMVIGLLVSMALTLLGSSLITALMDRCPWLVYAGAGVLSLTASRMVFPSAPLCWQWPPLSVRRFGGSTSQKPACQRATLTGANKCPTIAASHSGVSHAPPLAAEANRLGPWAVCSMASSIGSTAMPRLARC